MLDKGYQDRDCYKELLDATIEDHDEMGRAYALEIATLSVKLE